MNRVLSLLARSQKETLTRILVSKNKYVLSSSRLLASNAKPPVNEAKTELEKPQWERTDRFVKIFKNFF